jgi:hypothetical protein
MRLISNCLLPRVPTPFGIGGVARAGVLPAPVDRRVSISCVLVGAYLVGLRLDLFPCLGRTQVLGTTWVGWGCEHRGAIELQGASIEPQELEGPHARPVRRPEASSAGPPEAYPFRGRAEIRRSRLPVVTETGAGCSPWVPAARPETRAQGIMASGVSELSPRRRWQYGVRRGGDVPRA